jgi:glycine reductase complex component B subunit gamma
MIPVALMMGSCRIVPSYKIVNPMGNADLSPPDEKAFRRRIVLKALEALQAQINTSTLFERD